jgi:phage baseplate assembly protein W
VSEFEREIPPFRIVGTQFGDDLQAVAAREMGDANRWPELVWLNELVHPYITDDPARVAPGVLLSGAFIRVPAPAGLTFTDDVDRGQIYERDCKMVGRSLVADSSGDFAILAGADNLRQQLSHRIATPMGQARRHPEYGCKIYRLIGTVNGPAAGMLGAAYVKASLAADYRVKTVDFSTAEVIGDSVQIKAKATAIEGGVVDIVQGGS